MKQTAKATLNNLRIAPRKVRLLADLIRGRHVADALIQLKFSQKDAALPVMKLLRSAIANAEHNYQIDIETLVVKESYVDGGPILYRWMPRAFGRAGKIRKRTSHVTVVLEGDVKETKKPAKKEKKGQKNTEGEAKDAVVEEGTPTPAPKKKPRAKKATT